MESTDRTPDALNTAELIALVRRLPAYTKLLYSLYRSPGVSRRNKLLLTAGLGYLVSPIDLVPGFLPVAGQLDDIIVALTMLKKVLDNAPAAITAPALQSAGLATGVVDADLDAAVKAASVIARKTGKALVQTGVAAGKLLLKGVRGLTEIARQKRSG